MRGQFLATGDGFPDPADEFFRVVRYQAIRNPQPAYAEGSQKILFLRVSPHLAGLRVNPTVKLDRQSSFKAVEVNNPLFQAALAAEFCAQLSVAQQMPRRSFGVSLLAPQFADALGWKAHGVSIAAETRPGESKLGW